MSFDGSVDLTWGGDERHFRLGIDELLALQQKRGAGPLEIFTRLQAGTWLIEDLQETIRIGLIGGGLEGKAARVLIEAHVRPGRLTANVMVAQALLLNALAGDPEDEVGKAGATTEKRRRRRASPPPPSTRTAR